MLEAHKGRRLAQAGTAWTCMPRECFVFDEYTSGVSYAAGRSMRSLAADVVPYLPCGRA